MAESNSEEQLPLSQETCRQLMSLLGCPLTNLMEDVNNSDQVYDDMINDHRVQTVVPQMASNEQGRNYVTFNQQHEFPDGGHFQIDSIEWKSVAIPNEIPEQKRIISSVPARENWPGTFSFNVSFNAQKAAKGVSWIFSNEKNKLYVAKCSSCPINFSTNICIPEEEVYIRAMPLFSSSDFLSEKVTRCINHSMEEMQRNVFEAEHFVRADCPSASYENDTVTGHHSVIVPYENPPAGQTFSTYLYKFMCFGSCSGGPNRRPLMLVFTLERRGEVIGRQTIDLKVCACPVRDYNAENKPNGNKPSKRPQPDQLPFVKPPKQIKKEGAKYNIETSDRSCYKFLRKMYIIYNLYSVMKSQPNGKQLLMSSQSSSSEEMEH